MPDHRHTDSQRRPAGLIEDAEPGEPMSRVAKIGTSAIEAIQRRSSASGGMTGAAPP